MGLPYVRPHSVRDTLTQLAYKLQLDPEELKAWSVNLGHSSVMTTLGSYGHISAERQAELIGGAGRRTTGRNDEMATDIATKVTAMLKGGS